MGIKGSLTGEWTAGDYLGQIRTALGIRRNQYRIEPGLYALGAPDENSPVLVTANYRLTVNILRRAVWRENPWILVLDTKGVNVWCAAGKGTFGTDELVERIGRSELAAHVAHRKLILPQLGAPGIHPGTVKVKTGFAVQYGPVEARDIPEYIRSGFRATGPMRKKEFPLGERLTVGMTHFAQGLKFSAALAILFILADLLFRGFTSDQLIRSSGINSASLAASLFAGSLFSAALLPLLPGRAFSLKGLFAAIPFHPLFAYLLLESRSISAVLYGFGKILILTAFIAYQCLNLTGSSTYTSLSGVRKEMAISIPLFIAAASAGLVLIVTGGMFL